MRTLSGKIATAILVAAVSSMAQPPVFNPHGDPTTGALRITTDPPTRGECSQCHLTHGDDSGINYAEELFTENTNQLCFSTSGDGACHQARPVNYPLREIDRIPETVAEAGYFEANAAGIRSIGVEVRGRWPGATVYQDPSMTVSGHFISPHAQDSDMPRRDAGGEGLCLNCHDPHGTPNPFDILIDSYRGIGGAEAAGPPVEYRHCLRCHGRDGPPGISLENQFIEDYYDPGLNENAGHRIDFDPQIAISWPPHIQRGDMLPCYDCHNPHGSEGNNGAAPNAFLISDQRTDWSGLTETLTDRTQSRRFCLGCHILSDGIPGSQVVEGIVMNTLSDRGAHRSTASQGCYQCHGNDYSGPRSNNVHNPGRPGQGSILGDSFEP